MAEIPLRSYLHEIEKHIESGRTDQAVAHCRYILQSYPKYVDAYRLLGKAYLESQRFGDAGDILQRVLSSVPDDFVSHVGMSMIREDEGNLDEAIWHMERAFEVQPSNNAIQEELRRLYGKRDHVEPPKIRLTRGALARMYYKGELYQQAIGEIRATLADSPDRLDLQALLADIYLKINQRVEAADTALAVLHRLPNCMITNRVMIQVLTANEREMEQKSYRQRLAQLDPYSVFAALDAPSSDSVAEHSIRIEKLDWKPDASLTGEPDQPAWAASLGVDLGDLAPAKEEEALPDWLSGISTEPAPAKESEAIHSSAFTFDEAGTTSEEGQPLMPESTEEEIPDWLRQAGWGPSTGAGEQAEAQRAQAGGIEAEELPVSTSEAPSAEEEVSDSDMPDWLKAMAPPPGAVEKAAEEAKKKAAEEQLEAEGEVEEEDVTPWLEKLIPPSSPAAKAAPAGQEKPVSQPAEAPTTAGSAQFPDWLQGAGPVIEEAAPAEAEPAGGLPDWLTGEGTAAVLPEVPAATGAEPTSTEAELPDWISQGEMPAEAPPAAELPSEPAATAGAEPADAQPAPDLPDWLLAAQAVIPEVPGEQNVVEPAVPVEPTPEPASGLPDWLLGVEPVEPETAPAEAELTFSEGQVEAEPSSGLPDWLLGAEPTEPEPLPTEPEPILPEPPAEAEPSSGLPDWLLGAEPTEPEALPSELEPTLPEPQSEAEPSSGLPDWLLGAEPTEPEAAPTEPEPILPEPPAEAEPCLRITRLAAGCRASRAGSPPNRA